MNIRALLTGILAVTMAVFAVSCGNKNIKKNGSSDMVSDTATMPSLEISTDTTEGSIRGEFTPHESLLPIHFDFDRYGLSEEARQTLQKNSELLKSHKEWLIMVEGHCDSRGTTEYNLALGQKRAKEVRDYYTRLGIPESAIGTISYGEEKPLCEEETDECWAKNRRAETKIRVK